jgi:hypothetical protein
MMSIVANILGKRKTKKKSEPVMSYDNPTKDGLYRICLNDECQTMFQIDDDKTKAGLCWSCALRVMRSGHYLANHITTPPLENFPDSPAIKKVKESNNAKLKKCACGKKFSPTSNRQTRCPVCSKTNRKSLVAKAVRKCNFKKKDRD